LALKNFAQFVSMAVTAPVPLAGSDVDVVGVDDEVGDLVGLVGVLDVLELLHPVSAKQTLSIVRADTTPAARKCIGCIAIFCRRSCPVNS